MASPRSNKLRLLFRILYRSVYFLLMVILLGLLVITPADAIERSIDNHQRYNIFIIASAYAVTIVLVGFVYAMRLYVNKTSLASIPKSWLPIEKGDVKKRVHRVIVDGLDRSAAIQYEAHPRVWKAEKQEHDENEDENTSGRGDTRDAEAGGRPHRGHIRLTLQKTNSSDDSEVVLPPQDTIWSGIEHPGWASPNSADLPNLEYNTVVSELPNLIEAKALTLAPPDPTSQTDPPLLDAEAVSLLQRPQNTGLRSYLNHLIGLGVFDVDHAVPGFLSKYEQARFSTHPLSETQFRELMHVFAELLRAMRNLDMDILDAQHPNDDASFTDSDIDNDAPLGTNPSTPRSRRSRSPTGSTDGSSPLRRPSQRDSAANTWQRQRYSQAYLTAQNTPQSSRLTKSRAATTRSFAASRHSSAADTFAQTRRPYPVGQSSSPSLRSKASKLTLSSMSSGAASVLSGSASGSVIRLATRDDESAGMPYILSLRETASS